MAAVLVSAVVSCSEDMDYEPGSVTPVKQLLAPADNYYLELQSAASESLRFAWAPAYADDGVKALYEIVFMKTPNGEILHRFAGGMDAATAVSHKDLNKIAGAVGLKTGTTGDVYWSVVSVDRLGVSTPVEATPRCLTIKRLNGFEEIPEQLYLLGEGTDAGDKGLRCFEDKKNAPGEFTVIAKLEAGKPYYFVSTVDEGKTPRAFAIDDNGVIAETATPTMVPQSGIYRIMLDFNTRGTTTSKINKIQLYQCTQKKSFPDFTYEGRGVWTATDMKTESGDDRYLFHVWTNDSANWNEKWASVNWDNSSAPSLGGAADFWRICFQTDRLGDDWGYSFKWAASVWGASPLKLTVDIRIVMNVDDYENKAFYYHEVSYK